MSRTAFEEQTVDGSTHVVVVRGELDLNNAASLRLRIDRALAEGHPRLVIDMSEVTHMDSSGLAELIRAQRKAAFADVDLALVIDTLSINRTLEVRGVRDLFTIAPTRDGALALLDS